MLYLQKQMLQRIYNYKGQTLKSVGGSVCTDKKCQNITRNFSNIFLDWLKTNIISWVT